MIRIYFKGKKVPEKYLSVCDAPIYFAGLLNILIEKSDKILIYPIFGKAPFKMNISEIDQENISIRWRKPATANCSYLFHPNQEVISVNGNKFGVDIQVEVE
ncbi:MAG: hypothetical protein V4629_03215 [Pseudomonadota bacterium]